MCLLCFFFFFQAEDGIRDVERSRGLGDVYKRQTWDMPDEQQFAVGDFRTLDEVIKDLSQNGFIPSFCTGCYRTGRTGIDFMAITKPGFIQEYCHPNALVTFKEYLLDYASEETRNIGEALIRFELEKFTNNEARKNAERMIESCLLYTSPSPRDLSTSRMPSSA
eukprot:TRINITY_DN9624_c0_g1_i1.p1 TRINITY_DN9624_c0_g1~~TRINITY_DN9624_c0_g1_i1.p1  ORF type:complete len:165 (-),score=46.56 TRINITY_DN9624_c0_g1_i1:89-583(-)